MKMKTKSFIQRYLMRIIAITVTLSMVLNMIPLASLHILTEASAAEPIGSKILVENTAGTTSYDADEAGLLKAIEEAESGSTIDIQGDINITSMINITKSLTLKSSNGSSIIRQKVFVDDLEMLCINGSDITVTLKDIIIDGNNISDQACAVYIGNTNHLIIENGTIIKNNCSIGNGGGIYNDGFGMLTINGGEISNNTAEGSGGGIYNYGTLTINGGEISNNTTEGSGGGICNFGTLTIKGGTISGNNSANNGGGIHNDNGKLTLNGGTISGNNATLRGGGVYCYGVRASFSISGTATVTDNVKGGTLTDGVFSSGVSDNVCLDNNNTTINVTSDFTGAVGINLYSASTGTVVTGNLTSDSIEHFFIDRIAKDGRYYDTVFNTTTNTIDIEDITGKVKEVSADGDLQDVIDSAVDGDYINVKANQNVSSAITVSGKDLTIFSSTGSKLLKTNSTTNVIKSTGANTKLTLRDIIIDGLKDQNIATDYSAVSNEDSAKLILNSGTVIENNITNLTDGAGVSNSSYMLMNGGVIRNNTSEYSSSGVRNYEDSTFTMNGGTISNNEASSGSGVYNGNAGTFTMNNGTISHNTGSIGGGVYNAGTFTMNNGTISHNTGSIGGGGVLNDYGTFTMNGGTISHNTGSIGGGGGVSNTNNGTFTMTDGIISHNTAASGGGVFNFPNSTFTMDDGTISHNTATGSGGGVLNDAGTFTINGGTISHNTASYGGGVSNYKGTFTMNKGTVSYNTASSGGGGVYIDGSFVAVNSSFIGNTNDGIRTDSTVYLFHCTVADNTGTGVYVDSTNNKLYIYNSIITGNTVQAINGELMSKGENIIDDGDEINRKAIFGDLKVTDGFISVAKGGLADKTADILKLDDIEETGLDDEILEDIIEKLKKDQRNEARPSSESLNVKVNFGSIESSVGTVTNVVISNNPTKTSDEYRYGDELDLSGGSLKVTYDDVRTKTVLMSDPEVEVSGYSSKKTDEAQNVILTYDGFEAKLAELSIKVSRYSPSLALTAGMEGEQPKKVVLTANLTDWYYNEDLEQKVEFYAGGRLIGDAKPDENGKATLNYQIPLFGDCKFTAKLIKDDANNESESDSVSYKATGKTQTEFELSEKASDLTYGVEVDLAKLITGGSGDGAVEYKIDGTVVNNIFTPAKTDEITIKVTKAEDINYNEASKTFTVNVKKKELTINVAVNDKAYDGLNTARFTGTPALDGVVGADEVNPINGTPTFKTTDVGNDIEIIFTSQFSISGKDKDKYTLTQPTGITADITNDFAPQNGTHYTTNLNDDGWTNDDFVIKAKEGYEISTDNKANSDWNSKLTYSEETANSSITFYIKDTATGAISLAKTEIYKVDKTAPTASVKYQKNNFKDFLNTVTFGLFFKDKVDVSIQGTDDLSGVEKTEYFKSTTKVTDFESVQWISGDSFSVQANEKFILYTRVTDKAGNVTINYDGIVVYTDSQKSASGEFIKDSGDDVTFDISMNDNTVKEIKNGTEVLTKGTHYTLGKDFVTFKNTYLKGLNDGDYEFIISYYPLGETEEAKGDSQLPDVTTVYITKSKAEQTGFAVTDPGAKTYGDKNFTLEAVGGQTNGNVTFTVPNEDVISITNDGQVTINNAGTVTVTVVKSGDDTYKDITQEITLTINKKPVTITADDKTKYFGDADPELTWTVSGLVGNDKIKGTLTYSGSDVGTYDIIQDEEFTNNNYDISFVKGTMSITFTPSMDKTIDIVKDLPNEVVSSDDANKVADIIKEYDKLSDEEKEQLPAETKEKAEKAKVSVGKINHTDSDAGITISGDNLSWNIRLASLVKDPSQSDYLDFADKLAGRKLLALYDIKLTDILTGESYEPPAGETIIISLDNVDLKDVKEVQIAHEKKDGSIEYIPATIKDGKVTFEATSFSLYGVIAVSDKDVDVNDDKKPQTGENQDMLSWIGIALAVLALVVIVPCCPVVTKRKNRKKI